MKHIKEAVEEYLKEENSSYAILLTGKWGIGKTHYYNNELAPMINTTNTIEDNSKPYKAVYISLFGLKSIKDVQVEIFWALNNVLSNNKTRKVGALLQSVAGGIAKKLTDISTKVENIVNVIQESAIDYKDIVLCFDDLERRHSSLSFEEITGYINNLTEHEKAKVLIIANEDKIEEENYKNIKEKVIHDTLLFEPDWKTQVESFIKYHYGENSAFGKFLLSKLEDIIKLSEDANCNLRTLDFTLKKVQKIYCQLEANNYSFSSSTLEKSVYIFTILTCIHYKIEQINSRHRNEIRRLIANNTYHFMGFFDQTSQGEQEDSKELIFAKKVGKYMKSPLYFDSIFEYLTGKTTLSIEELIEEIKSLEAEFPDAALTQVKLAKQLYERDIADFNDEEHERIHEQILDYADKGLYLTSAYPTLYVLLMQYGERLYHYKANELAERLERGMNLSIKKHDKNYSKFYFPLAINRELPDTNEHNKGFNALLKRATELEQQLENKKLEQTVLEFYQNFKEEWKDKLEELKEGKYRFEPILTKKQANNIYSTACSFPIFCKDFINILDTRYADYREEKLLKQEQDFFISLHELLLPKSEERQENNIHNLLLDQLLEKVKELKDKKL